MFSSGTTRLVPHRPGAPHFWISPRGPRYFRLLPASGDPDSSRTGPGQDVIAPGSWLDLMCLACTCCSSRQSWAVGNMLSVGATHGYSYLLSMNTSSTLAARHLNMGLFGFETISHLISTRLDGLHCHPQWTVRAPVRVGLPQNRHNGPYARHHRCFGR